MDMLENFVKTFLVEDSRITHQSIQYTSDKSKKFSNQKIPTSPSKPNKKNLPNISTLCHNDGIKMLKPLKHHKPHHDYPIERLGYTDDHTKRGIRNMFTMSQIDILERTFDTTHFPDSCVRDSLSKHLGIHPSRIQVWFQNRRAKWRKLDQNNKNSSSNSPTHSTYDNPKETTSISTNQMKLENNYHNFERENYNNRRQGLYGSSSVFHEQASNYQYLPAPLHTPQPPPASHYCFFNNSNYIQTIHSQTLTATTPNDIVNNFYEYQHHHHNNLHMNYNDVISTREPIHNHAATAAAVLYAKNFQPIYSTKTQYQLY